MGYRALFREVPAASEPSQPGSGIGLRIALEVSLPIFVTPSDAPDATLEWEATVEESSGDVIIRAHNAGGRHVKINRLALHDGDDRTVAGPRRQLRYVLPGARGAWRLNTTDALTPGMTVRIRAEGGRSTFDASVPLD